MKNIYLAHTKGQKDYQFITDVTRQDLKDNNYIIDVVVTQEVLNRFNNNLDCIIEYFANICDCDGRSFRILMKVNA